MMTTSIINFYDDRNLAMYSVSETQNSVDSLNIELNYMNPLTMLARTSRKEQWENHITNRDKLYSK